MKFLIQQVIIAIFTLYLTSYIFNGLEIKGGTGSYIYSGFLLVMGFIFLRPIINTITLPIAALTFNLFTLVTTLIIVYLITLLNPQFNIVPFNFPGLNIFGYIIPAFKANIILSYILISVTIHILYKLFIFIFDL